MKTVLVISDYIEGQPVVASVRYAGLMKYFQEKYTLVTINDMKYGSSSSYFSQINYKFTTPDSIFTQSMDENTRATKTFLRRYSEQLLRHKWMISAWRNYKYSKYKFMKMNHTLFTQLDDLLDERELAAVFVTVPDVYGLYILEYLKNKTPTLPAIIEIRDIINHDIGEGNPRFTFKRSEHRITKLADGIIAVSQGIQQYYQEQNQDLDIQLIKNGYDEQYFLDCSYKSLTPELEHLTLVHLGSIYKGRNIKAFIEGLLLFNERTGIPITLHIVGLLDQQAFDDISDVELLGSGVKVEIIGSVEHEKALALLKAADIAVILTHTKGSDYAIPGKTFEYIGACKPIIAVTQDRELVDLVHGKYGECARHDKEDIADGLMSLLRRKYDYTNRSSYSRRSQAEQVMNFIDRKIGK
ncbi:hypothetical protein MUG84_01840 [Paenibacillus sp. KQZ6P-2]|uniref:Glycosyl transferase family 1 domain-containing protein n=1 Tax=Paenibacillus mangrovi TaxID=2931978 RepID=A0A9X1WL25_9BACL|nr:glycosyltransferase [Paenibacillus mangrovi]MCJ8010481.1 hypothetical protein [Paenibacillus mangrovi]